MSGGAAGRRGGEADGPRGGRGAILLLLGLVVLSTGRALGNGFAFDDVPIVLENTQLHDLAPPWVYAQQSYWPPKNLGDAYRPWTVWWLALQWAADGGSPWVFHLGSLLLTVATTLVVFGLATEVLPRFGAVAAGALFAVHPVHVEATANIVGQGELWMTGFTVAGCLVYLRARRRGLPGPRTRIALVGLLVLAAASKEQGIVLLGLLLALECLAVPGFAADPFGTRLKSLAPSYGFLGLAALGFLGLRYGVLGDLGGGPPAAGLEGADFLGRTATMLPLVPELIRLLFWPARLLAQYSPPAHAGASGFGGAAILGGAIVIAGIALGWRWRRSQAAVALGLTWIGLSILPVSNLLFPTGVLIAERTLLLPSVGAVMIAGALLAHLARASLAAAIVPLVALLAAGTARSWSRQPVWRDNPTLFAQTVIDEPRSYRGHFVLGRELARRGESEAAIAAYQRAGQLYQRDHRVFEEWGQIHRAAGRCDLAVPIFERGVAADSSATVARSRLFECLFALGEYRRAETVATDGVRLGFEEFKTAAGRATKAIADPSARPPSTR